ILPDGGLSVSDDGRGIPVEEHPTEKKSNLEVVMTIIGAGGKFDNKAYKSSAGLHGMGAKAVTALIETTVAEVRREWQLYQIKFEVAFQYTTGDEERVRCYANNQFNPNGGTHLTGFRKALTRTINNYAEKQGLYKEDIRPEGKDFNEGLTAVVNVTLAKPHFEA